MHPDAASLWRGPRSALAMRLAAAGLSLVLSLLFEPQPAWAMLPIAG